MFQAIIFKVFIVFKLHLIDIHGLAVQSVHDLTEMSGIRLDQNTILLDKLGHRQLSFTPRTVRKIRKQVSFPNLS